MTYEIPNHILDIIMPIAKSNGVSPIKLIEQAILEQYEDNVCQRSVKEPEQSRL